MAKNNSIKYKSDFRPATQIEQVYNKVTGLWEVGGAKPKPVATTKTKVSQKAEPIYVTNSNDPRLKSYQDSLALYNDKEWQRVKFIKDFNSSNHSSNEKLTYKKNTNKEQDPFNEINKNILPIGSINNHIEGLDLYKKPVQEVIYQKKKEDQIKKQIEVKVPVPKKNFNNIKEKQNILGDNVQYQTEPDSETNQNSIDKNKGNSLNDFLTQTVKTQNGVKTYKRKDTNSDWIEQYKYGGKLKKYDKGGPLLPTIENTSEYSSWFNKLPKEYQDYNKYDLESLFKDKKLPQNITEGSADYKSYSEIWKENRKKGIFLPRNKEKIDDAYTFPLFDTIDKYAGGGIIGADGKPEEQSQGMSPGGIVSTVGNALDTVGNFIPVDNDGRGVSETGQKISGGIQTGLDSAADIANSIPGGQIIGGALKIGSFLTKGITAIVDAVKEHKNPTDELVNEKYSPTHKDSAFSFGMEHLALGGSVATDSKEQFKQYNTRSHAQGGQMLDANNNPTVNSNKAKAEIEKQENSYKDYVFSDELGFAKIAKKINNKYKDREDLISKNTLDIELTNLMKKNEAVKKQIEQNQQMAQKILEYGGIISKEGKLNELSTTSTDTVLKLNDFKNSVPDYIYNGYLESGKEGLYKNVDKSKFPVLTKQLQDGTTTYLPYTYENVNNNSQNQEQLSNKKITTQTPIYQNGGKIPKAKLGLPTDPDYFTQLMQENGIMNFGNIGPVEDRSMLGPLNKTQFKDANGIDIEPSNDNFGKGIGIDNSEAKSDSEFYKPGQVGTPIKAEDKKQFSPEAIAGYGIKGAEMLGHLIQVMKKPDYVKPVYNPEENKIKSLMSNRQYDSQAILNALDLQDTANRQNISDNSTSVGVMQANLQKANANQVNAIANTKIQEQQANNQYRADEAQVLNNIGQQKTQAQVYAEDVNAKSKANVQNQRDKFLKESIGGLGDFLLKKDYVNKDNEFQMNILRSKGINFTPTDYKTWNKAGIDIVKFDAELESTTDTEKRKELIEITKQKFLKEGGTEEAWNRNIYALQNKQLKK
jgi:hypothetical protein